MAISSQTILAPTKIKRVATKMSRFISRYHPMRFKAGTVLHDVKNLRKFEHASATPPVVLDKGVVMGGIGWAQVASVIPWGRRLETIQYAQMSEDDIRAYCREIRRIARKDQWAFEMPFIELQFLENALSLNRH